jgi:hypothetical protein
MTMLPGRPALALLLALGLLLGLAVPASAFELTNCTLQLTSTNASGATLDTAQQGPTGGGTLDDPFVVDWDGSVHYYGTFGSTVLMNHSWHIDVFLIPTPLRGGDPNTAGDPDGEDTVGVGENAPFKLAGLFYVSGDISSEDGSCVGSGWFRIDENPFETLPFWLAVVIVVLALLIIWFSKPSVRPVA